MMRYLLLLLLLSACTYEMNPPQGKRAHNACESHEGLAYVDVDTFNERVNAKCRNGTKILIPYDE